MGGGGVWDPFVRVLKMGTYNILIGGTNSISVGFSLQPVSIAVERSIFHIFLPTEMGKDI